jgi:hypothetical protein
MILPVIYKDIPPNERWRIRNEYVTLQNGLCKHCNSPLSEDPPEEILNKKLNMKLFPPNFLKYPVHLHHCHETGLTIGAVHCYCNGVLWQYHGE